MPSESRCVVGLWLRDGDDASLFRCKLDENHEGDHATWVEESEGGWPYRLTWPASKSPRKPTSMESNVPSEAA